MKFKIEKIGRVSEGLIELKPLTMFIGKNDSGKTYAASAIWSFNNHLKNLSDSKSPTKEGELKRLINFLNDKLKEGEKEFFIPESELNALRESIMINFNKKIGGILEDTLGYKGFGASQLHLLQEEHVSPLRIVSRLKKSTSSKGILEDHADAPANPSGENSEGHEEYNFELNFYSGDEVVRSYGPATFEAWIIQRLFPQEIHQAILGYAALGKAWANLRNTIYLPAARTGIMLALDYFLEGAVRRSAFTRQEEIETPKGMPAPIRDFASKMARPLMGITNHRDSSLEKLIQGEFSHRKKRGSSFFFKPDGGDTAIPLAATSSLVTELAAFCMLGGQLNHKTFLIFEEPEAHLHLEAQREMARVLARLVNKGVHVLITTHSDTFLQQINNLICLSDHPNRASLMEELDIKPDVILSRDSVSAFDFKCINGVTSVLPLELTKTGFVAESLNEVLIKLANETLLINADLEADQ